MKQYIPNPSNPQRPRPVHLLTDRALRYRANSPELRPAMPKICAYCGGHRNVEVEHIDGHEEHLAPDNLIWACRSCNTKKGLAFRNAGLGRRTRQYNPAASGAQNLAQWLQAVMAVKGESEQMSVADAVAMIRATPAADRSRFAYQIWARRRARRTDKLVPF